MKRWLTLLSHQENANENYSETTTSQQQGWLYSTRQTIISGGKDVEKQEPFCTFDGNADWCSHCGKQYGDTSKN